MLIGGAHMAFGKKKKKELENTESQEKVEVKEEASVDNASEEEQEAPTPSREVLRKENGPFKGLGFVFKIAGAALLLAIFVTMSFNFDDAQMMIITVTGAFISILCVARFIFYMLKRKTYTKWFKIMNLVEVILDGACGLFLLIGGIYYQSHSNDQGKFIDFMQDYYRFFVGAVIYLRGALHFFATAFFKSKSTIYNYFVNLVFVTLGTFCLAYDFTLKQLVIVLLVVIALSCIYLAQDGIRAAIKYWNGGDNNGPKKSKKKDKEKNKKKENEIPAGIIEPETQDQAIIS